MGFFKDVKEFGKALGMDFNDSVDTIPADKRPKAYIEYLKREQRPENQGIIDLLAYSKRVLEDRAHVPAAQRLEEAKNENAMFKDAPAVWLNLVLALKNSVNSILYPNLAFDVKEALSRVKQTLGERKGEQKRFATAVIKETEKYLYELSLPGSMPPANDNKTEEQEAA